MKPRLKFIVGVLAALPTAVSVLLRHRLIESFLFFPLKDVAETPEGLGLPWKDVTVTTSDGEKLHAFWVRARQQPAVAHVLYLHGNGGNVGHRVVVAGMLAEAGLDVFLVDYRGFGRSTGKPTEEGTYLDSRAAREELLRQEGVDPRRIAYLGESLGCAVAIELATEFPPQALVLQAAFVDVDSLAQVEHPYIPKFLIPDAYESVERLPQVTAPVLLLHGDRDSIIPLVQGQELAALPGSSKELRIVPGADHNDIPKVLGKDYGPSIAAWIAGRLTTGTAAGGRSPG